jgi:glycosyltransferase involved in cell wall biosynthesis
MLLDNKGPMVLTTDIEHRMLKQRPDCLLIEGCDFQSFPPGGQLSIVKQMMSAYRSRVALVGICTDATPVGRWVERDFGESRFLFYGVRRRLPTAGKPLLPARLTHYLALSHHREGILSLGVRAAFVQAPEELMVVSRWGFDSLCYWFPGVENPLAMSRYPWAFPLARWFDSQLFRALARVDVILASANEAGIKGLVARSRGRLARDRIHQLSTYYDSAVFFPVRSSVARRALGIEAAGPILVSNGRLNRVKGWDLILSAFTLLLPAHPDALLIFVGDGEDRNLLESAVAESGVRRRVRITGFQPPQQVALWLNAADLVVVGSHKEGWSVAMLEALGCGKALVSTDVSGARHMIRPGENGFIAASRTPEEYAYAVRRALVLPDPHRVSIALAGAYDSRQMARRIGELWKVMA